MFSKLRQKREEGFTIIEVMIVLAIAGLIMVVVLIAIPQLQRNQRNNARRSIMGRVATEINNYAGNNNGKIPINQADLDGLKDRYLTGLNLTDPKNLANMGAVQYLDEPVGPISAAGASLGRVDYRDARLCNGEDLSSGSGRNFALWTELEGGAIVCLDNR